MARTFSERDTPARRFPILRCRCAAKDVVREGVGIYERMCDRRAAIAAVVRANYWFGLFTASGMALTDRLEVSVYAPGVLASDRLIGEEFGGKFAPSHADDHVTTHGWPWPHRSISSGMIGSWSA